MSTIIQMHGLINPASQEPVEIDCSPENLAKTINAAAIALVHIIGITIHFKATASDSEARGAVAEELLAVLEAGVNRARGDETVSPIYYSAMDCVRASVETMLEFFNDGVVTVVSSEDIH